MKDLQKHYTNKTEIDIMFNLLNEYCDFDITEFLENSAGSGNIVNEIKNRFPNIEFKAYDIYNETNNPDIKQLDYLKEKIEYKKGRVCLINPPFKYGIKFLDKALTECDMVICILFVNSLTSIKFNKIYTDKIYIKKNVLFGDKKYNIMIGSFKRKENINE